MNSIKSIKPLQDFLISLQQAISERNSPLTWLLLILLLHFVFRPGDSSGGKNKGGFFYCELIEIAYLKHRPDVLDWYRVSYILIYFFLLLGFGISLTPWRELTHIFIICTLLFVLAIVIYNSWKLYSDYFIGWTKILGQPKRIRAMATLSCLSLSIVLIFHYLSSPSEPPPPFRGEISSGEPGEKLLIDNNSDGRKRNDEWLKLEDAPWKTTCKNNWTLKEQKDYNSFLKWCPNDPEAQIYLNNKLASNMAKNNTEVTTVNIAVAVPISRDKGMGVFQSIEILKGVAVAQKEINEKGEMRIGKKKGLLYVHILDDGVYDHEEEKQEARSAATYLASVAKGKKIIGVIGHSTSDATEAAARIYQSHGLAVISPTSTSPRAKGIARRLGSIPWFPMSTSSNELDLGPNVLRVSPNDEQAAKKIQDYIYEFNKRNQKDRINKIIVIHEKNNRYGPLYKKLIRQLMSPISVDIVNNLDSEKDECRIDVGGSNEKCKKLIQSQSVNAVVLVPSSKSAPYLKDFVNIKKEDWGKKIHLFGSDSMYNEVWLKQPFSPYTAGMVVVAPYRMRINGRQESWRTSMAYDATQALSQGIVNTSGSEICIAEQSGQNGLYNCIQEKLQSYLLNNGFVAAGKMGYPVQFDLFGDRVLEIDQNNKRVDYGDKVQALYCVKKSGDKFIFTELEGSQICA